MSDDVNRYVNFMFILKDMGDLGLAKDINLDVSKFKKDMNSDLISKKLENNIKFARDLNIRGTPSFIINKKVYPGAYKLDKLEEIIKKQNDY